MAEASPLPPALQQAWRDPEFLTAQARIIQNTFELLNRSEPVRVMEVCGGHTHIIARHGLKALLGGPNTPVEFIHGPGCPVCVLPRQRIDEALFFADQPDTILVTLADAMAVPGNHSSLKDFAARQKGKIFPVYSPLEALTIARNHPDKTVIYFAIGFETTAPATAALLERALASGTDNLLLHSNLVRVPEAMRAILNDPDHRLEGLLGPAHVSTVTGPDYFQDLAGGYKIPVVVAGFEPGDLLAALAMLLRQIREGRAEVENQYQRAVRPGGNTRARQLLEKYFEQRDSFYWRGLGQVPGSGYRLKTAWSALDAEVVYQEPLEESRRKAKRDAGPEDHKACLCGSILKGKNKPRDCKLFGRACTPANPHGPCMVSGEGACAAEYRYGIL